MRVLFVASDNNRTSGAFLSMTALNYLLNTEHGIQTKVILPNKGDGESLLIEKNIKYKKVRSFDWIVPINARRDIKFKLVKTIKILLNFIAVIRIAFVALFGKYDIIHTNTTYAYVGFLAAKVVNKPHVWHLREFLEEDQGRTIIRRKMGNQMIEKSDKILAISSSIYNKYIKIFDEKKLRVILNGIDTDVFYKPHKRIFEDSTPTLIYCGGFNKRKGFDELLDAIKKISERKLDFKLLFMGQVSQKYKNRIRKLGIEHNVTYLGYQKEVEKWYEIADISFNCSQSEAFGRKTVEAMMVGDLLIGADTAGTKELIENGKTGLLYRQGNSEDLANVIEHAITNPQKMKLIADAGREYMYNNMSARLNAEKVAEVYKEISSKK